jgi:hypothetical protein
VLVYRSKRKPVIDAFVQELLDKKTEITHQDVKQLENDVRNALQAAAAAAAALGITEIINNCNKTLCIPYSYF